ncbi:putative nucleotidyltransferase with HDIG domain [Candidatus Methylobacter favarea]|uniref:Putative nucleotidyltransferase with HDIG domain n=1 Tax=Candidatus Methylobacter favarea TaxID=2707345 RepID=A0A8S0WLS1_9GAMM|nr:HDOD domain-containing protein [Candidatus Methylobacter favarea]CAA9892820.1 putative nucleotidyltransferase with HDIG domain [Candidatus Methylobacter favarea]
MPVLKDKFACLVNLPPMPVLLMDALQQINGEQNLTTLVDKIGQDATLVIRVLRIANSPFYGMPREIGSLREAIVLIGCNRIRDMLVSICFSKMIPTWHRDFNYHLFSHHSMAVAECTREFANYTGNSPDFAFTAGLLHDIGYLVMAVLFPDKFSLITNESVHPSVETERRILGFDNVELGSKAAQLWNLPLSIQEAIEQHQTPPEPGAAKSLGLLVYTANLLIAKSQQSDGAVWAEDEPVCTALDMLNISIKEAMHCTDRGRQFADQIITLF